MATMRNRLGIDEELLVADGAYWTAREICQQPDVWLEASTALEREKAHVDGWLAPKLSEPELRIILAGAGSSSFIGETLAPWLTRKLGRRADAVSTTDLVGHPALYLAENVPTLMISFARSGDSPESIASVTLANQLLDTCHHLVVTCNRGGRLGQLADRDPEALCLFLPQHTNDHSFAMTSSFTSMLLTAAAAFAPQPKLLSRAVEGSRQVLDRLAPRARALAEARFDRLVFLGGGSLLATAREAALKCIELTNGQVIAISDTPLGFRHGPKAVVNETTCVMLLRSVDPHAARYDLDLLKELRADRRAQRVVVLSPDDFSADPGSVGSYWRSLQSAEEAERPLGGTDDVAEIVDIGVDPSVVPGVADDFWVSLPYLVFCQAFAFFAGRTRGVSADNPCPTGEINRVVQGVTVHRLGQ